MDDFFSSAFALMLCGEIEEKEGKQEDEGDREREFVERPRKEGKSWHTH